MLPDKKENSIAVKEVFEFSTLPDNFKHIKTVAMAMNDKCDSLAAIRKKVGKKVSLSIIKVWIINLNDFLNISRKMNQAQIEQTADLIYDEFYYFKVSDIALLMKRIKTGHYGQFYESIDGMKLMDMFYKYAEDRLNLNIDSADRDHNEQKYKDQEFNIKVSEKTANKLKEFYDKHK